VHLAAYVDFSPTDDNVAHAGALDPCQLLYHIFYEDEVGDPVPDDDNAGADVPDEAAYHSRAQPVVSATHFERVLKRAYGRDWRNQGGTFRCHFSDSAVTGRCKICLSLQAGAQSAPRHQRATRDKPLPTVPNIKGCSSIHG
jgi:hypothetical protein